MIEDCHVHVSFYILLSKTFFLLSHYRPINERILFFPNSLQQWSESQEILFLISLHCTQGPIHSPLLHVLLQREAIMASKASLTDWLLNVQTVAQYIEREDKGFLDNCSMWFLLFFLGQKMYSGEQFSFIYLVPMMSVLWDWRHTFLKRRL